MGAALPRTGQQALGRGPLLASRPPRMGGTLRGHIFAARSSLVLKGTLKMLLSKPLPLDWEAQRTLFQDGTPRPNAAADGYRASGLSPAGTEHDPIPALGPPETPVQKHPDANQRPPRSEGDHEKSPRHAGFFQRSQRIGKDRQCSGWGARIRTVTPKLLHESKIHVKTTNYVSRSVSHSIQIPVTHSGKTHRLL